MISLVIAAVYALFATWGEWNVAFSVFSLLLLKLYCFWTIVVTGIILIWKYFPLDWEHVTEKADRMGLPSWQFQRIPKTLSNPFPFLTKRILLVGGAYILWFSKGESIWLLIIATGSLGYGIFSKKFKV